MNTTDAHSDAGSQPEKYIRTFESDMESAQKGEIPEVALPEPVAEKKSTPLVPPPPAPVTPPPAAPAPAEPKAPPVSPLKTYSGDFSDHVKETNASTATVLAAEQDAAPAQPETSEERRSVWPFIVAGVLIVASVAGIAVAYLHYNAQPKPVVVAPLPPTPIFVDEREEVSGSGTDLIRTVQTSVAQSLSTGTVRLLYFASSTNSKSVFSALALSAPDVLLRNIQADGSMAGVINIGGVQSPFFILSVASYSETFAGMLSWESVMPLYLSDLFPLPPAPQASNPDTATTTDENVAAPASTVSASSTPVIQFFDTSIANHDARVYRDSIGNVALVYGYWNRTTLVIARDTATFTEILGRLATARTTQ